MSGISTTYGRAPTLMGSMIALRHISGTQLSLLDVQTQISSNRRFQKASEDPVAAALITSLDRKLELTGQRERNLSHASSVLGTIDGSLGDLSDLLREAKTVASSQIGVGSDGATRAQQAAVIGSIIDRLYAAMNGKYADLSLFAGGRTGGPALEAFGDGYRYLGDRSGLRTDLGPGIDFPITISANDVVGSLSARVSGDVDLNAAVTGGTRIDDLRGPRTNRALGALQVTINSGGPPVVVSVDLTGAETVGDVTARLESAIRQADPAALAGTFPGGITTTDTQFQVNIANPAVSITFQDGPGTETARALGLDGFTYSSTAATNTDPSRDLNPRVTAGTALASLLPTPPLTFGGIRITNGGRSGTVNTSPTMTVGELIEAVRRLNVGVRAEIGAGGDTLDFINEVAGARMSIEEAGGTAATTLGVRSLKASTLLSAFNDGRGVQIADGQINPVTGLPDPNRNTDFRVTLSDGTTAFDVDLRPQDMQNVQTLLARINAASGGAGGFVADIDPATNGIRFRDTAGGAQPLRVSRLNGYAADDLGLLDAASTSGGGGATLVGSDRSKVRVDSAISTLIELRQALATNDERGITFAGSRLEADLDRLATARATVGARAQRIDGATKQLQDEKLVDQSIKSNLQDTDVAAAATRLSLLQTQLQATLTVAAQTRPLSLLNFLG
ncbi:MAG: hypothetical protein IBJ11_11090 [Phycisphaerales bacterium]|nr:hypothetical protein [Phycisphaerales bacterium]